MVITAGGSVKLGKDRAQDPGILDKDGTQHIGGDVEMLQTLLKCGADIYACNNHGRTPADEALLGGNVECMQELQIWL